MGMQIKNTFGDDMADIMKEQTAERIGERIRAIREFRKLSREDVKNAMGLSVDRIQKYENGAAVPRMDVLKKFAGVLGVETMALLDSSVSSYIGVLYALFEMDERYKLEVKNIDGKLYFSLAEPMKEETLYNYLTEWYLEKDCYESGCKEASSEEEREKLLQEYNDWKWNFPKNNNSERIRALKKKMLEKQMEDIKKKLNELN